MRWKLKPETNPQITSKLANNTEVIAFLSSGVSFWRFLRPYFIGGIIVASFSLFLGMYLAPKASKGFNEFKYKYLSKGKKDKDTQNLFRQINDNDYIYVSNFDTKKKRGNNFTLEHFEGNKLIYKIEANSIRYRDEDSLYRLINYTKRTIGENEDIIIRERRKDTLFEFELDDLTPVVYFAETLSYSELSKFIDKEESNIICLDPLDNMVAITTLLSNG